MKKKEYALTKNNLVYMGLYEPFYELYCSYRSILSEYMPNNEEAGAAPVWPMKIKELANKRARSLFNDFFKSYSCVFAENEYTFHVNEIFMKRVSIIGAKRIKPLSFEMSFPSFSEFLVQLEDAVAFLIRNKKEKECLCRIDEEAVLKKLNSRIQEKATIGKSVNSMDCEEFSGEVMICTDLFVYSNLKCISCNRDGHALNTAFCYCRIVDGRIVRLPVHFCAACHKYFIGIESLKIYEEVYGKLIAAKYQENERLLFDSFGESELYKTGYNAKENGMTDSERREHLKMLIATEKMKPFAIIRDLEYAITLHKYKYADRFAVERWREDLKFVNDLTKA